MCQVLQYSKAKMQDRTPHKRKPRVREQYPSESFLFSIQAKSEDSSLARREEVDPKPQRSAPTRPPREIQGVYIISVAARILEMHPQTLRKYERLGLISPSRTMGMLRLYSQEDIEKLKLIRHLEENLGLNLAGVEFTLELLTSLLEMLQRLARMKEAQPFVGIMEREMAELFRRLNLPLEEDPS